MVVEDGDSLIKKYIQLCKSKKGKYPDWMTRMVLRVRKYKAEMWIRYRESKNYNDYVEYKGVLRKTKCEYKKAKMNFERKLTNNIKSNPKSFYAYVRRKAHTKDKVGPLKDDKGILYAMMLMYVNC